MMWNRRRIVLGACLVMTLAATAWVSRGDENTVVSVVAPVKKREGTRENPEQGARAQKSQAVDASALELGKLQRTKMTVNETNPFGVKSWFVPPPPPPPAPPPAPTAPPLPFVYQGKLQEESGRTAVYLMKGEQLYVVHKGEVFDSSYRMVEIENGNLVILYIPLSTKQNLPIGGEY